MSTITADRREAAGDTEVFETPFRHAVLDDWAPAELVRAAEAEWPDLSWPFWHRYENGKLATKDPLRLPPASAELVRRMLCLPVGEMLGVEGAFGDWNCHGAGLHAMPPGSSLGVHLDSDHYPITGWQRAVNAVLYVNSRWENAWGGAFELYDAEGRQRLKVIEPRFNRLVLFTPSDLSYHAVAPVTGPETRKTLTVFFWRQAAETCRRPRARFLKED
jgi:hypothetical protein